MFAQLWQKALESGLTVRLFRDEVISVHQYIQSFYETIKGYNKRIGELKEFCSVALQQWSILTLPIF